MKESKMLKDAREYQAEHLKNISSDKRPVFHLSSPVGWINDPNGFSEYNSKYHLFYQYHPYEKNWGPMHWGHSISKDFIKWEYLPPALAPDREFDCDGCFSGSAIEYNGEHILLYTGVVESESESGKMIVKQEQCIAIGDGIDYKKWEQNPVIISDMLPKGSISEDFRDPKLWYEDGIFYAVVASRDADGSGQAVVFSSKNLTDWDFYTVIDRSQNRVGKMWECPDFFKLNEKAILMLSPMDMTAEGLEFHDGNGVVFIIGHCDKVSGQFEREKLQAVDYGLDFYAPQSLLTSDGRRIITAWLRSWDNKMSRNDLPWTGMMTVPRELFLKNGRIYQLPVREIKNYYANKVAHKNITVCSETELPNIRGRAADISIEICGGEYEELGIKLAKSDQFYSLITYNREKEILTFDRTFAGCCGNAVALRSIKVKNDNGRLTLRILIDKFSVEIFANDGESVMTSMILTDENADMITFRADKNMRITVTKYDIVT